MHERAQRYHNSGKRNENAMDVDGVAVNAMMAEEKADCMKRGACFFCKNTGHMAKTCPKKQGKRKPWQANQVTTQTQVDQVATDPAATPTEPTPPPPQTNHDQICGNMRSLPQEERRALLDQMLDEEGF
jgi:Zinc knuckle